MKKAMAFCSTGLLIGLIIGLSRSPIVAALGTGVIGLLSQFLAGRAKKDAEPSPVSREDVVSALLPVSLFCIAGIVVGITIRVNDLLYFGPTDLRSRLTTHGFSKKQVDLIMDRWARQIDPDVAQVDPAVDLLNHSDRISWKSIWHLARAYEDATEKLDFIRENAPQSDEDDVQSFINERKQKGESDESIIGALQNRFRVQQ